MMKRKMLGFTLLLVGLGSLTTATWLGFGGPSSGGPLSANPIAGEVRVVPASFRLPNYTGFNSNDVCSGQNLMNPNQRASWNCQGSFGACMSCLPINDATPVILSGLQNGAGSGSVQSAGGNANSCNIYEQYAGNCGRQNGVYSCTPAVDLQQTCQGTYLDYMYQGMSVASGDSRTAPDRRGGDDRPRDEGVIVVR